MTTYNKCKNLLQLFLYLFLELLRSFEEYKIFDSSIVLQLFDIVAFVPFPRFVQAFHRIMLLLKSSANSSLFSCFKKSYICFEIYVTNKMNRTLNIVGFTKRDGKKSTIFKINHLQSKINDEKAYIKNFKKFAVIVSVYITIKI